MNKDQNIIRPFFYFPEFWMLIKVKKWSFGLHIIGPFKRLYVTPSSKFSQKFSMMSSKDENQQLSMEQGSSSNFGPNSHSGSHIMQQKVRCIVPKLTNDMYKGQCGRVCIFGGCIMYTGAPYFAAISALKTGADLVHVFCEKEAGQVIKSYSPELIVHPVLDTECVLEEIDQWLPRFHSVVIGPGLGRNQSMLGCISIVINKCKANDIPIVIDADGLWHLTNNPNVIKGYKKAVLTPNAMEFSRLVHSVLKRGAVPPTVHPDPQVVLEVSQALGGVTIVHKGSFDMISNGKFTEKCNEDGCPRR